MKEEKAMKESRTQKAKRNILFELMNAVVKNVLPFVTRTVMIYVLGKMYLGLSSLFTSILQVLSLAELGFGSAVVYSMYKPLAEEDHAAVNALLNLYRKIYRVIGLCILALGLAVMPFLRRLISGEIPAGINLYLLYGVSLADTVISYFLFAYKKSLLQANQRSDIISKINMVLNAAGSFLRIGILLIARNYYLYCLVAPCVTIGQNLLADAAVRRMYPQYSCEGDVPAEQVDKIRKNVTGLVTYKIGGVFRNSFDSIVLSSFLGLGVLGCYNNYYYIINTIINLMQTVTNSMIASIGNKLVLATKAENHADFQKFQLGYMWINAWCTVCLYCLYQPFMRLWVGEDMMFSDSVMIVFCVYFFVRLMNLLCYAYRQAAGLWWEDRYRPLVEAFSNLLLNVILVRYIGVLGVLLSTVLTLIPFNTIWGSYVLYSKFFTEEKYSKYLLRLCYYAAAALIGCVATGYCCQMLPVESLVGVLIARGCVCVVVPNILFLLLFRPLPEFAACVQFGKKLLLRR